MIRPDPNLFNALSHHPERRADLEARMLAERLAQITRKAETLAAMEGAAPSESAWQRHLNAAGRWAAERVLKEIGQAA